MRLGLVACLLTSLLASAGCSNTTIFRPSFALESEDQMTRASNPQPLAVTSTDDATIRVEGRAFLPDAPSDAVNVTPAGNVTGTPVTLTDAYTGKRLGLGGTFYDGSFTFEVTQTTGVRAVVATLDVVSAKDPTHHPTLASMAVLTAGVRDQHLDLTPASTVMAAFFNDLAAHNAGVRLSEPYNAGPSVGSSQLISLLTSFKPDDEAKLQAVAAASPELDHTRSIDELTAGMRAYVDRLRGSLKP